MQKKITYRVSLYLFFKLIYYSSVTSFLILLQEKKAKINSFASNKYRPYIYIILTLLIGIIKSNSICNIITTN